MSEIFKIESVGIDTSEINQLLPENFLSDFKYVHTSIKSGNDSSIKIGIPGDATLITTIEFLDKCEIAITNHLKELDRDYIDMLLIDSSCDIEYNVDIINNLITSGVVREIGISNPRSLEDFKKFNNIFSDISCISLEICPLNFNYDVIKYCNENDIKILGFNPFGGRINYPILIESFTIPYLLAFSAVYSNIVFLSGSNIDSFLWSEEDYLLDLINREYGKEFVISQNIDKLIKCPKKTINTSLIVSESLVIPYTSVKTIFSYPEISFNLGKSDFKIPEKQENDELTELVYKYYDNFDGGPIDNKDPENTLSILRPRILDLARLSYPVDEYWEVFSTKVSDCVFIISVVRKIEEKRILRKTKETTEQVNYILYYSGSDFVFQKIENANI